ncbi:unnamed protein product, partial [Pocillopora meandrina]
PERPDHSLLDLRNICSGNKRRCNCQSQPPLQKKRTQEACSTFLQSNDPATDYRRLYY